MSTKSNDQGRAYEYICLIVLEQEIQKYRQVRIVRNSSLTAAHRAWETLSPSDMKTYEISAMAAVYSIFEMEPCILEDGDDILELLIQNDGHGQEGDVRDILIIRRNIEWEIGLSLKHNHFAVKHSRLSSILDFGKSWYDISCSDTYWNDVRGVFNYLAAEKRNHTKFSDLPDKENDVYIPLLKAFMDEINRQYSNCSELPKRMVEYLLGKFDFYKVISIDRERLTRIQGFNLHGTLNRKCKNKAATIEVPIVSLPTRIVQFQFVPNKNNTVELYLDGGWQFSFRIHNAETYVTPSLKFDVQIVGMPTAIITINSKWR